MRPTQGGSSVEREQFRAALVDLRDGLLRWPLWFTIGWIEIKQRYRRSLIGPFWITLSVGILVGGLGAVYSALFRISTSEYLPYLATGIIIWTFLAALLQEGCAAFTAADGAIKQNPVPISVHVYRVIWRNLIVLAHNAIIYVLLLLVFPIPIGLALLAYPVGLLLAIVSGIGFSLILGTLSARFRDIPLILANFIQVMFFVTPIFWHPETMPADRRWVAAFNPLYHLMEVQRAPLLGHLASPLSYAVASGVALFALVGGVLLYGRFARRIAYWL